VLLKKKSLQEQALFRRVFFTTGSFYCKYHFKRIKPASTQEERQRLIRQWSKGKLLKLSSLLTEAARKSFGNAPRLDAINCKRLALFGQGYKLILNNLIHGVFL